MRSYRQRVTEAQILGGAGQGGAVRAVRAPGGGVPNASFYGSQISALSVNMWSKVDN